MDAEEAHRSLKDLFTEPTGAAEGQTRARFVLDEEHWASFVEALDRPVRHNAALAKLFSKPTAFE